MPTLAWACCISRLRPARRLDYLGRSLIEQFVRHTTAEKHSVLRRGGGLTFQQNPAIEADHTAT
jgi:hypothetical protein